MRPEHQVADQLPLAVPKNVPKVAVMTTTFIAIASLSSLIIYVYYPPYFRFTNPTTSSLQSTPAQTFHSHGNSIARKPHTDADEIEASRPPNSTQNDLPLSKALEANGTSSLTSSSPSLEEESSSGARESELPDTPQAQEPATQNAPEQADESTSMTVPNYPPPPEHNKTNLETTVTGKEMCDLFSGDWVPNPDAPYYTNETCHVMLDLQNCMKFGKPNMSYLKWKWKPDGCDLPKFDPNQFLEIVRGKSIIFVGDSLAGNHMHSLWCMLSGVALPLDLSPSKNKKDGNQHWVYKDYSFNISYIWNPFLVRSKSIDPNNAFGSYHLYLDEFDVEWTTKVEGSNYIIISAGIWFMKQHMLYENGTLIGCVDCKQENVSRLTYFLAYEKGFRTAFRAINSLKNFEGVTFLRTVSPTHFEGGAWNEGGDCTRTRPYRKNETLLAPYWAEMRRIQLQELKAAEKEGRKKRGSRFRLIDPTMAMLLRPDGHPSKYGRPSSWKAPNDCTHWCMPGPADTWNEMFFELLRREEGN